LAIGRLASPCAATKNVYRFDPAKFAGFAGTEERFPGLKGLRQYAKYNGERPSLVDDEELAPYGDDLREELVNAGALALQLPEVTDAEYPYIQALSCLNERYNIRHISDADRAAFLRTLEIELQRGTGSAKSAENQKFINEVRMALAENKYCREIGKKSEVEEGFATAVAARGLGLYAAANSVDRAQLAEALDARLVHRYFSHTDPQPLPAGQPAFVLGQAVRDLSSLGSYREVPPVNTLFNLTFADPALRQSLGCAPAKTKPCLVIPRGSGQQAPASRPEEGAN
ncbi:MAG TPA: hypothetical protein VFV50_06600, partial [Bdellovibrionales bacterium]|nr:hypothetical protein [Bdellovibrionales bacterium]